MMSLLEIVEKINKEQQPTVTELYTARFLWPSAQHAKAVFSLLETLGTERLSLQCELEKIGIRLVSPRKEAMIIMDFPMQFFEEYAVLKPFWFTTHMEAVCKAFKSTRKEEKAYFEANLTKIIKGESISTAGNLTITRNSTLKRLFTMEADTPQPHEKDIPNPANYQPTWTAKVAVDQFEQLLKSAPKKPLTEHLAFSAEQDTLTLSNEDFKATLTKSDALLDVTRTENGEVKAHYDAAYLRMWFQRLKPLSAVATVAFAKDAPIRISFTENYEIAIWLAPTIIKE